ncbi:prepilin-type N-terminal cleavage/methylation domain-containing protein [Idiomarina sp. A28L]|nr:prepilin-type N-terminal cleavage/methylation domain-containing protein [Idiomarina sp. A28L]
MRGRTNWRYIPSKPLSRKRVFQKPIPPKKGGFTLPEVMLCLVIITLSLPAAVNLLAHSTSFWQRANSAYSEDSELQEWLTLWQQSAPSGTRTGQFSDGRNWRIESIGELHSWWVEASDVSPEERGWYLP